MKRTQVFIILIYLTKYFVTHGIKENDKDTTTYYFVKVGETARLICNVSKNLEYRWVKEDQDGKMHAVHRVECTENNWKLKMEEGRYSVNCTHPISLIIKNVTQTDAGFYYCSGTFHFTLCDGGTLVITGSEDPKVSLLVPLKPSSPVKLLCVVYGWSDGWSEVEWLSSGRAPDALAFLDTDGTLRSLIEIPGDTEDVDIACSIKHKSTGKPINATLVREAGEEATPNCYIVLYVGFLFIVLTIVVHLSILARRHQTFSEVPGQTQRRRRSQQGEVVVYSAVKSTNKS